MIKIDLINDRLVVILDPHHEHYRRVYIVVQYLLSSFEFEKNKWYLSYDDVGFLRKKLDMLGLAEGRTVSPSAFKRLDWMHSVHQQNVDIKSGSYNSYTLRYLSGKLKTDLYSDQVTAVSFLINNRRCGLFDSMGSGKTISVLASVVAQPNIKKTLVVCPKGVLLGFEREIKLHTFLKSIVVPSGRVTALNFVRDYREGDWDIMLVHPENLITSGTKNSYSDIYKLLESMTWDMIIIDEFHMYKNVTAKRTKCVMGLLSNARDHEDKRPRAVAMTGTPVSESPINAFVLLKVFGVGRLLHINRFENYYCIKKEKTLTLRSKKTGKLEDRTFLKVVGFKNLEELKTRMERISIRRDKSDMLGFPDQTFMTRDVYLKGKQLSMYKFILSQVIKDLPESTIMNLHRFLSGHHVLRLRQLSNHPLILDEEGESAKYDEIDLILEELFSDPEQKVVIWTEYRKAVELLEKRYKEKYGAIKLYGGVDVTHELVDKFEKDDSCRVLVSIPAKAGTGTDFLARARTAIYVDRPYSYTLYKQSLDRIHRRVKSGNLSRLDVIRAQPANVIFLDVIASVDALVRDRLMQKGDMVDALVTSNSKLLEIGRADLLKYLK